MSSDPIISEALNRLQSYVEKSAFKGFDPYDIHNSRFPVKALPHTLQFVLSQINKRSPYNFRKLIGIEKNYHTKAMGLLLSSYCNMSRLRGNNAKLFYEKALFLFQWLANNISSYSENVSWGFDYNYSNRKEKVRKGLPTVVHHNFVLRGLVKYWDLFQEIEAFDIINKADVFVLNDIPVHKFPEGACFGYRPNYLGCCYNASLHAAESLAIISKIKNSRKYIELIEKAVQYVVCRQKASGVWYYGHGKDPAKEKKQIDFHQGFILESLDNINILTDGQFAEIIYPAIQSGLKFYYKHQFDKNGRCKFRLPRKYPIDIHNQAQGIITFSKFSDIDFKYEEMADSIVKWTINNMQDPSGFFYYQKYRGLTNKVPYIRWGQAWMFLALTDYLLMKQHINSREKLMGESSE